MSAPEISVQRISQISGLETVERRRTYYSHDPYPRNLYYRWNSSPGYGSRIRLLKYEFIHILENMGASDSFKIRPQVWALNIWDFRNPVEFGLYRRGIVISHPVDYVPSFGVNLLKDLGHGRYSERQYQTKGRRRLYTASASDEIIEIRRQAGFYLGEEDLSGLIGVRLRYYPNGHDSK